MRWLSLFFAVLSGMVYAGEQYPLWDGHESVADYAKRVNLPPTKTLELGNGIKMELVLIPAGRFIMGTSQPTPVDERAFQRQILIAQVGLSGCVVALLIMLMVVAVRFLRRRSRPQFSLAFLLLVTVTAGLCSMVSGLL
jgi:hypothetical protein